MNKNKIILTLALGCLLIKISNGQLYVNSAGSVSLGSAVSTYTTTAPFISLQSFGNSLFSTMPPPNTNSAAYILGGGVTPYSSNATPDYTWWGDIYTGIYHPAANTIGFTVDGWSPLIITYTTTISGHPNPQIVFTSWINLTMDWNSNKWSTPTLYPSTPWGFQLGTSTNYIGDAYISHVLYNVPESINSDSSIKKNINYGMDSVLIKLKLLKPATYNYKTSYFDTIPVSWITKVNGYSKHYGFIAEDIVHVFPELVMHDSATNLSSVSYSPIIPMLVKGFQYHDSLINKIDSLPVSWKITGNTGITNANFLGSIDSANLTFKAHNVQSGLIDIGHYNTAFGLKALISDSAFNNVGLGANALAKNKFGRANTGTGAWALYSNTSGDSNSGTGDSSLYFISNGNGNSALGYKSGLSSTNKGGDDNTFLEAMTDVNPASAQPVNGATAVGANAVVRASNVLELGNNNVTTTLGLSGFLPGQGAVRLEVNTANGAAPFTVASGGTPPSYVNGGAGTGWSGVRLDDLTSSDLPGNNPGPGVISIDQQGNLIYVNATSSADYSPTICSLLKPIPLGGIGYNFNPGSNFYFAGNGSNVLGDESVIIGNDCSYVPQAKLDVLQHTGGIALPSIGLYVENDDIGCTPPTRTMSASSGVSIIGIKSYLPAPSSGGINQIAGWFEADGTTNCCGGLGQYALFVPNAGGTVSIGWNYAANTCSPGWMLTVNGTCNNFGGYFHGSDSTVKTSVASLTNPLSVIKKLKGVSYNFITSVINDSAMAGQHYGFIAQQVQRVLPAAVRKMNYNSAASLLTLSYDDIVPWLVEGMKQQQQIITNDSARISHDSLRINNLTSRFDSVYNYLMSVKICLDTQCHTTLTPKQKSPFGNSQPNNNVQDVTLSSASGVPLLYQNRPNPFTGTTTINYYLPEGTMGATIVFYDTYGVQLKVVDLSQTGNGTLNITPDNLAAGIYSYSLVVNNAVVDTKRMILQK